MKHDGISLTMDGAVNLQVSSKNVGILEAFYNAIKVEHIFSLVYTSFKCDFVANSISSCNLRSMWTGARTCRTYRNTF